MILPQGVGLYERKWSVPGGSSGAPLQKDGREGRQGQRQRIAATLPGVFRGIHAAKVSDVRAAISARTGVEHLFIVTWTRHADVIAITNHRCRIQYHNDNVVGHLAASNEAVNAMFRILD